MTLEEVKAWAEENGYYLQKKSINPGRLLKHCGKTPFRPYDPVNVKLDGKLYFSKRMYVKCRVCGKTVEKLYENERKDFMRADIGRLWNEEVEKEVTENGSNQP